ncbi:MAG TPA: EamA family transporter [Candidatus Binatia bacterium]|nr:EamA family transporter [Candidatus Binatia bacterium]
MKTTQISKTPTSLVVLAFAAIYIIWGSTYLAIRVAVETLPPFLAGGCRFFAAGGLMFVFLRWKGFAIPTSSQWRHAAITGTLLLVGGNGLVMWAERTVPSGLTALIIALAPVWFALLEWLRPGGARPQLKTVAGIIIGFVGVTMLITPRGGTTLAPGYWVGPFGLMLAGISWAAGSLYSKHNTNDASPWMNSAAQMICGGAGLLVVGFLLGEPFRTEWSRVTSRSLAALAYLTVVGSWVGFSAYVWLLSVSTPTRVSTYAYVNPVIAVFLGWALLHEVVTVQMIWGTVVIVAGVVTITVPGAAAEPLLRRARRQLARLAT